MCVSASHNTTLEKLFYHYRLVVCTHCGHATVFKHRIKVIFFLHSRSPLSHLDFETVALKGTV